MKNIIHQTRRLVGIYKNAFTLIELLIVIVIVAILAAILFPVFGRARENARRSACQSNLKPIGLGIMQYTQDYDETMPPAKNSTPGGHTWRSLVQPYIKSTQVFVCPSNPKNKDLTYEDNSQINVSYGAFAQYSIPSGGPGADRPFVIGDPGDSRDLVTLAAMTAPATVPMVGESTSQGQEMELGTAALAFAGHLSTWNVLWADGHVKSGKPSILCQAPNSLHINGNACNSTEINQLNAIQAANP